MNAQTRLSAKGQVVIPKDVRERLAWSAGTPLDVIETTEGLTLRRAKSGKADDIDAAIARLQATVDYRGPYISEEEWAASLDKMFEGFKL